MNTTLNEIRSHSPCTEGWKKLLNTLGKTQADDEPVSIAQVLDSNGLDDALWCLRAVRGHDREIRLFAVWCARKVQHLMNDKRSLAALDVADCFANGQASESELGAARDAALDAAWAAEGVAAAGVAAEGVAAEGVAAAGVAVLVAAREAAGEAARSAARDVAWAAAWEAAREAAREAAGDAARSAAGDAAWVAAWDAAGDAARDAQAKELRRICEAIQQTQGSGAC